MADVEIMQATVWIFGYGSLMWDGWDSKYGCTKRTIASLPGHRRIFNKASVERWGTKRLPGPTLNLAVSSQDTCDGIAFEFPARHTPSLLGYLKKREGLGFQLRQLRIQIESSEWTLAFVPIYEGKNLIQGISVDETATMVCRASGSAGRCVDYVRGVAAKLVELKIADAP